MDANQVKTFLEEDHPKNIERAAENLKPILLDTPLIRSDFFSEEYSCNVYLKPENLQMTRPTSLLSTPIPNAEVATMMSILPSMKAF
jgi:hypothetical protein